MCLIAARFCGIIQYLIPELFTKPNFSVETVKTVGQIIPQSPAIIRDRLVHGIGSLLAIPFVGLISLVISHIFDVACNMSENSIHYNKD